MAWRKMSDVWRCQECGDAKETRDMRTTLYCKTCFQEKAKTAREMGERIGAPCAVCARTFCLSGHGGMCPQCREDMRTVLAQTEQRQETRVKCQHCQGRFDAIEMLNDMCVYCGFCCTHDREKISVIAARMRANGSLRCKMERFIAYNRNKLEVLDV